MAPKKAPPVIALRPRDGVYAGEWYYLASSADLASPVAVDDAATTRWRLLAEGENVSEQDARNMAAFRFGVTAAKVSVVNWPKAPAVWHAAREL